MGDEMEPLNVRWELSMKALELDGQVLYKVTQRFPTHSISETQFYSSKEEAQSLFQKWLNESFC